MSEEIDKVKTNESFQKMDEAFGTEFDGAEFDNQLKTLEEEKSKAITKVNDGIETLEDKAYLQEELKILISSAMEVLNICKENIKIGSNARDKEVYFGGVSKVVEAIKELRELNKTVREIQIDVATPKTTNNLTVNMKMDSRSMLKYLNKLETAQKENSLNAIDAEFNINADENNFGEHQD